MNETLIFNLDEYIDEQYREFGAELMVEVEYSSEELDHHGYDGARSSQSETFEVTTATLFTFDQDGGESRQIQIEPTEIFDLISEDELRSSLT